MAWVPKGRCGGEHQGHLHEPNFSCPDCSNRGTPFDGSSGRSAPRRNWHRIGAQGRAGTVDLRSSIFAVIRIANSLPDWLHFPGQCSCNYTVMRDCHPRFVDRAVSRNKLEPECALPTGVMAKAGEKTDPGSPQPASLKRRHAPVDGNCLSCRLLPAEPRSIRNSRRPHGCSFFPTG